MKRDVERFNMSDPHWYEDYRMQWQYEALFLPRTSAVILHNRPWTASHYGIEFSDSAALFRFHCWLTCEYNGFLSIIPSQVRSVAEK